MAETVLFVSGTDPLQDRGGGPTYVRAHARAAMLAGFRPRIFCVSDRPGPVEAEFGTVHRVASPWRRPPPGRGYRHWLAWLHVPILTTAVLRFVESQRHPRLIHAFGHWGAVGVGVARRAGARRPPVVSLVSAYTSLAHEFDAQRRGPRMSGPAGRARAALDLWLIRSIVARYERQAYRDSRLVLVNYESVRRLLIHAHGARAIRRVPYAPESAFDAPVGRVPAGALPPEVAGLAPPDAPLIVAVSRHDARKGVDVLLRALALLRVAGVPFRACLVGGWTLLEAHRRLARRLGLGAETCLPGLVPDPQPYLRRADVFVLPSLQEGSGSLSLLEAFQAEVAVVASRVDGVPEDVTDGLTGLLVPPGDAPALAATLARLLGDAALRARLARAGCLAFQARFSADALVGTLRSVYGELGFRAGRSVCIENADAAPGHGRPVAAASGAPGAPVGRAEGR